MTVTLVTPTRSVLARHRVTPTWWRGCPSRTWRGSCPAWRRSQRVLLAATWKGLATTPISQAVEVPAVRRLLIDPSAGLTVQMVLRIGYGTPAGRAPRRPLSDVLLPLPYASRTEPAGRRRG